MLDLESIEQKFIASDDHKCAIAKNGMVATAFPEATEAGVTILKQGGNAVDAACAAALALGVCEPQASGIGGQSMAILHINGKTIALDGSSRVPSLAHHTQFREGEHFTGYRATTVPSTIAVLYSMNHRYGKMDWPSIVEPAIHIARKGYIITQLQHRMQARSLDGFFSIPSNSGAKYFLKNGEKPFNEGDLFVQHDLADTLEELAGKGPNSFYLGEIAHLIEKDMIKHDGFLRADDMAYIPWPIEREPLKCRYRGLTVQALPPPAAGRTLLLVLMMLNNLSAEFLRKESFESYHFIAEALRRTLMLRTQRPYDRHTYPQIPVKHEVDPAFAKDLVHHITRRIDPVLPHYEPDVDELETELDTTHLSVMDKEGNVVGITQSIERVYGSKVAAEGLGFLYNNYMSCLDTVNPAHPYYLRPNAIPWTSVAPAIVLNKKGPWLVVGSPGSSRIYSAIGQFLMNMIDKNMSMCEAMKFPRIHCSIGGRLSLEGERFDKNIQDYLAGMGYKLDIREPYSFYLGAIHAVMKCFSRDEFHGVSEIRRDGIAKGI
jgi:gamma-glutamyltranspeptidase/glutathione hydrolase